MPIADGDGRCRGGKEAAKANQHDRHGSWGRWGDAAVEHDAKLAMVRIAGSGMDVRDLHHGQKGQQSQAQHRGAGNKRSPA
ncbi:MAG TPA: hypothetical protein VGJ21_26215 [Terracidiphilus sp.]|jgi:hypothetical protein